MSALLCETATMSGVRPLSSIVVRSWGVSRRCALRAASACCRAGNG